MTMAEPPAVIVVNDEATWPQDVRRYLEDHHDVFYGWDFGGTGDGVIPRPSGPAFDQAYYGLQDVLDGHLLHGYHCTRLTDAEIEHILATGMQLPCEEMLRRCIEAVRAAGLIDDDVAARLLAENQSAEKCRANLIWFCFFPPHLADQSGVERFFRSWGGEALYNFHEDDPVTGPALAQVGTPCLVEAEVPIAILEQHGGLGFKIIGQHLLNRGFDTGEPVEHEDRARSAIPAERIRRVIWLPDPEFMELTGCADWDPPLGT